jgi:hypothetical protein
MRSMHGVVDKQDYNDGTQNDPPIRNLNASYRCFPAKPFHRFPPNYPVSVSALGYRICNRDWPNLDHLKSLRASATYKHQPRRQNGCMEKAVAVVHTPAWQMVKLFS